MFSGMAIAQPKLGVKAGVNWSRIESNEPWSEMSMQRGAQAGVVASWPLSDRLSFRNELLYIKKGGNAYVVWTNQVNTTILDGEVLIHYLEVPIYVDYAIPIRKKRTVVFGLGLFGAVGIGGDYRYQYHSYATNDPSNRTSSDVFKGELKFGEYQEMPDPNGAFDTKSRWDCGVKSAIGFRYPNFTLEMAYGMGFLNIGTIDPFDQTKDWSYTRSVQIGVTFYPRILSKV